MKKNSISLIIIMVILVILQSAVSVIFLVDFSARQHENYQQTALSNFNFIKSDFEDKLRLNLNIAEGLQLDELSGDTVINQDFNGLAAFNSGVFTLKTPSFFGEIKLNETYKNRFKNHNIVFYSVKTDSDSYSSYVFFKVRDDAEKGNFYAAKNFEDVFLDINTYDYQGILVLSEDGVILSDLNGKYGGMSYNSVAKGHSSSGKSGSNIEYITIENSKKLVVYSQIASNSESLKLAAYISTESVDGYITQTAIRLITAFGIILALAVVFAYTYMLILSNKQKLFVYGNGFYKIRTDSFGAIIKTDKRFKKKYKVTNIFDHICEPEENKKILLDEGLPFFISLLDVSGNQVFLSVIYKKTVGGYAFIARESASYIYNFISKQSQVGRDDEIGLYNMRKFKEDVLALKERLRTSEGMFILFELTNANNYRTMFGLDFYFEIKKKYGQMLTNLFGGYGTLYLHEQERFAFLTIDKLHKNAIETNINLFMKELNNPISIGNNLVKIDCVAGVVVLKQGLSITEEELATYGSVAVLKSTQLKRLYNVYDYHNSKFIMPPSQKRQMVKNIINNQEIEVYFQPQFDVSTNKIVGFEALTRIKGKNDSSFKIQEFIEIAEQGGFMITLGDFVFQETFKFASEISPYDAAISLNVSPIQLLQSGFVKNFLEMFKRYQLKPHSICLEITETFLMSSFNEVMQKLEDLSKNGIDIHLDDFGVAYSSMLYLKKLPISAIKIDREFVVDIATNRYSRVICNKIIDIANELNLKTIAEGVETSEQLEILKELKCNIIQGYLIGMAVPADKAMQMLNKYNIRS